MLIQRKKFTASFIAVIVIIIFTFMSFKEPRRDQDLANTWWKWESVDLEIKANDQIEIFNIDTSTMFHSVQEQLNGNGDCELNYYLCFKKNNRLSISLNNTLFYKGRYKIDPLKIKTNISTKIDDRNCAFCGDCKLLFKMVLESVSSYRICDDKLILVFENDLVKGEAVFVSIEVL